MVPWPGVDLRRTPNFCTIRPTFEKLFCGVKVQGRARTMGVERKTCYEIDPRINLVGTIPNNATLDKYSLNLSSKSNQKT